MSYDFDLFVIGGGSGGVRAARVAAQETGARVGLAEEDRYGGTCVIRGCVPKKLMVYASGFPSLFEEARAYGWPLPEVGPFDWNGFHGKLVAELDRLEGIYRSLLAKAGVRTFDARARIVDPHCVELSDGQRITARHILIATGGRPLKPEIPGAELGITSNEIFHLNELPKRLLIVGGGFIACEFAGIMRGLGVEVTQYYRGQQILRGFDEEASGIVAQALRDSGVKLRLNTNVQTLQAHGAGVMVRNTAEENEAFDVVMFATGRAPNTANIGLEEIGINIGKNGEIPVDQFSQTAVPSVYAIGDVTNRINLTPVAIREGMAFVDTVFRGQPTPVDHELVASAVFTQPQLGTVGLTEEEARTGGPVEIYATSFHPMREGFAGMDAKTLMKLVVCAETRRVLGCHIVAPEAGELIQLAAIAVKMGATKEDFDRTVAVHPTMAEELVTMRFPTRSA